MAYNGTLFKIGGVEFPHKWIFKDSYSITPHVLDLDSNRNTSGVLQRNILDHKSVTITFQTVPMPLDEYEAMWAFIRGKYTDVKAKKLRVAYYDWESGELVTMDAYIPDVAHNPNYIVNNSGLMNSTTLEFIGY